MPRQTAVSAENNFIKGLVTENTALKFPENACTETFDCVFTTTGRVQRRLGFDFETNYETTSVAVAAGDAVTEYVWYNVGGDAVRSFYVVQQGAILHFYDISTTSEISSNKKDFTYDLDDQLPAGSSKNVAEWPCQYAISDGDLIIVSSAINPFSLRYDSTTDTLEDTTIVLKIRDFAGVDDGLAINARPTATVAGLISTNPEHYYNILNQGWYIGDSLSQWDAARSDMPSNADTVPLYRASATDAFDNARVTAQSPGTAHAPNGHFILDVWDVDRPTAITASGFTGVGTILTETEISRTIGTAFGSMTGGGGLASAFDGVTSQGGLSSALGFLVPGGAYVRKHFGVTFRITSAIVHGPNDGGFDGHATAETVTLLLYGKNGTAPTAVADGTLIGTTSFTGGANESAGRTITSTDTNTFWQYVWVRVMHNNGASNFGACAELRLFTVGSVSDPGGLEPFTTIERPSTVAHLNGRLFYGGIDNSLIGNNIYFTRIIRKPEHREECHQQNDPTSEEFADLLPDDGGVLRIPEMGAVKRIFSTRNSVLVFATNGVWLISGSAGQGFLATDYVISRITGVGTDSGLSFIDYNGLPFWWGEDGIYTVKYSAEFNSYETTSVTLQSIKSFYLDIPSFNRNYIKGTYDSYANTMYWLYNDTAELSTDDVYTYNKVLCYNGFTDAFFPWTIGDSDPVVQGITYLQDAERNEPTAIKYTTTIPVDASNRLLTFSEVKQVNYIDWQSYADDQVDQSKAIDYVSYFITGYKLAGAAQRYFQPNYCFLFLEQEENASAYLQAIYDFTNSGNSGKWSSKQQVYNALLLNRDINFRRLKLRGKGRSLQLRVNSESGKPFTIIGWSIWESLNSEL